MKTKYYGHSKKPGVYQITNTINGKVYIGSAKEFKRRYKGHIGSLRNNKHSNKYLQASFNRHGSDAFIFEVLEVIGGGKTERTKVEQQYLNEYIKNNRWDICYNHRRKTICTEKSCFSSNPEETKEKMSEASKKLWEDPEYRKKMSDIHKNLWQNPEFRKKMGAARQHYKDPEFRRKISESQKGRKLSEKHKRKIGATTKKLWQDPKYRKKTVEARKGGKHSEEAKRKMSEAAKKRWKDPEYRELISKSFSEAAKERCQDPDYRKRMSEASKKLWEAPEFRKKISEAKKGKKQSEEL